MKSARPPDAKFDKADFFRKLGDPEPALKNELSRGAILQLDKLAHKTLKTNKPKSLKPELPWAEGKVITV